MELGGIDVGESEKRLSSPVSMKHARKISKIHDAIEKRDIQALGLLATSEGGLISDDIRRQAWPLLLNHAGHVQNSVPEAEKSSWRSLPEHRDEGQVQLDVDRSFIYYPHDPTSSGLEQRKKELSNLITEVLRRYPYLCYFQGYHDICQVLLLVLNPDDRAEVVARLSILRIRDFLLPTLAPALAQLRLIPAILQAVNPKLYHHLSQTQPFFALSGTLTMYAHDVQEYGDIARLFDVLLAREAVFSVYMFAQIVLQRSDVLFETPADEPEMLHSILSKLPRPLDIESLIKSTVDLFEKIPPEKVRQWKSISKYSVLKTARWQNQTTQQTLEDGEIYFNKQVTELKWADQREKALKIAWKYRRTAGTVGLAVFVGFLSYWLRRSTGAPGYLASFWRWLPF